MADKELYNYRTQLVRCIDGDTFDGDVALGFGIIARKRFRLLDVDTPERGQPDYDLARMVLGHLLSEQMDEKGYFVIQSIDTGKYGRWLAQIDGVNEELAKRWPYEREN